VSPVTSVAAERCGSILRKLGDPDRRNTGDTAVMDNMFFQNNRVCVDRLGTVAEHRCRNTAPKNNTVSNYATDIDKRDDITREQLRREKGQIARKKQQKGPKTIKQVSGQISLTDFLNKNRGDADNGNNVEDTKEKDNNDQEKDDHDDDEDDDDDDDDHDDDHDDDEEEEEKEEVKEEEKKPLRRNGLRKVSNPSTLSQKSSYQRSAKKPRMDSKISPSSSSRSSTTKTRTLLKNRKLSKKRPRRIESSDDDDNNDEDDNLDEEDDDDEDNKDDDDDDS
jgi:hypothetical protein